MKRFWFCVPVAACLVTMPAFAGTVDNTYNNTLTATNARGETSNWFIDADHTYKIAMADGSKVAGKWKIAGDKFCMTSDAAPDAPETCFNYVDGKNVGDSWDVQGSSGETLKVAIRAGR